MQRQRYSADAQLGTRLQSISLALVGDNTDLNCEVADRLARSLGYVPLATSRIIKQLTNQRQEAYGMEFIECFLASISDTQINAPLQYSLNTCRPIYILTPTLHNM